MIYWKTTQVPNALFDIYLPNLTESELKILLVIIRQTNGWIDKNTGKRKTRDRISHSQFMRKGGLSRRVITKSVQSLINKGLIEITDFDGKSIHHAIERKGKSHIYYSCLLQPVHETTLSCANNTPEPVHKSAYNKTNSTKINETKLRSERYANTKHIGVFLEERESQLRQQTLLSLS